MKTDFKLGDCVSYKDKDDTEECTFIGYIIGEGLDREEATPQFLFMIIDKVSAMSHDMGWESEYVFNELGPADPSLNYDDIQNFQKESKLPYESPRFWWGEPECILTFIVTDLELRRLVSNINKELLT